MNGRHPICVSEAGNPENQDVAAIVRSEGRLVMVVADGAGGLSGWKDVTLILCPL